MAANIINLGLLVKEKGFKFTKHRKAILEIIFNGKDKHLSSEEIYNIVKVNNPEIGLATVYRTLHIFLKLDIVTILTLSDGISRYEINKNMDDHRHHHLICTQCGKVIEPEEDLLDGIEKEITEKYGFKINDHRVKFYGFCKECNDENNDTEDL